MFFLNLYVIEKFVYFFKCDNVQLTHYFIHKAQGGEK